DDDGEHAPDEHEHGYREPKDDEPEVVYLLRLRVETRLNEAAAGRGQRQHQQQRQLQRAARAAEHAPSGPVTGPRAGVYGLVPGPRAVRYELAALDLWTDPVRHHHLVRKR